MLNSARYEHWQGEHLGIWRRRAVIAGNGLTACLQVKWMRYLVTLCWGAGLVQVMLLFSIGQLLVSDSIVVQWMSNLNPQLQVFTRALITWLEQHPEISIRTTYDLLFFYFTNYLAILTLVAIALAIPHLITRDLSSHAIVVYASKAINRIDYLIGKFGTLVGLISLTWLGPVLVAWIFGNLLSPHWHFFWHSRLALTHSMLHITSSMVILSILALGVSAVSSQAKATVGCWVALWLVGRALVPIALETKPWLRFFSFNFNLDQLALAVFQLKNDFELAEQNMPLFGDLLAEMRRKSASAVDHPEVGGALIGLGIMLFISIVIISRKARPE